MKWAKDSFQLNNRTASFCCFNLAVFKPREESLILWCFRQNKKHRGGSECWEPSLQPFFPYCVEEHRARHDLETSWVYTYTVLLGASPSASKRAGDSSSGPLGVSVASANCRTRHKQQDPCGSLIGFALLEMGLFVTKYEPQSPRFNPLKHPDVCSGCVLEEGGPAFCKSLLGRNRQSPSINQCLVDTWLRRAQ